MTRLHICAGLFLVSGFLVVLGACQGPLAAMLARLYTFTVIPPASGEEHTVEQGGSVTVQARLTMGTGVSGSEILVYLDTSTIPDRVYVVSLDSVFVPIDTLGPNESEIITYTFEAEENAPVGSFQIRIEVDSEIETVGGSEVGDVDQSTSFTLTVIDPDAEPMADDDDDNGGAAASCVEFVNHYNGLACTQEDLTVENSCSESISEFCRDEAAFNACRIENTVCEDGELVEDVASCFQLCE